MFRQNKALFLDLIEIRTSMRQWYLVGFTLTMLLFPGSAIIAQRIIVNSNGERIVMYPDGSWRLADAGDSTLIKGSLQKTESLELENETIDQSQPGSEAEQNEYILKQWNELHFNLKAQEKKVLNEFRAATNAQFSAAEIYNNAITNKSLIEPDRLETITENYESSVRKLRVAKAKQKAIKKLMDQSKKLAGIPPQKMVGKLNTLR